MADVAFHRRLKSHNNITQKMRRPHRVNKKRQNQKPDDVVPRVRTTTSTVVLYVTRPQ